MSKEILRDPVITVNGVDLSDHFRQIAIPMEWDEVELTSFGATWKEKGKGLLDGNVTGEAFQDFANGEVDQTLYPLFIAPDTTFPVVIKKSAAAGAVSPTNPQWTMTARLMSYAPLDGEVGAASMIGVTFANASQSGVVKATS